jgi:hypothetical protein
VFKESPFHTEAFIVLDKNISEDRQVIQYTLNSLSVSPQDRVLLGDQRSLFRIILKKPLKVFKLGSVPSSYVTHVKNVDLFDLRKDLDQIPLKAINLMEAFIYNSRVWYKTGTLENGQIIIKKSFKSGRYNKDGSTRHLKPNTLVVPYSHL